MFVAQICKCLHVVTYIIDASYHNIHVSCSYYIDCQCSKLFSIYTADMAFVANGCDQMTGWQATLICNMRIMLVALLMTTRSRAAKRPGC